MRVFSFISISFLLRGTFSLRRRLPESSSSNYPYERLLPLSSLDNWLRSSDCFPLYRLQTRRMYFRGFHNKVSVWCRLVFVRILRIFFSSFCLLPFFLSGEISAIRIDRNCEIVEIQWDKSSEIVHYCRTDSSEKECIMHRSSVPAHFYGFHSSSFSFSKIYFQRFWVCRVVEHGKHFRLFPERKLRSLARYLW